MTSTIGRYHIIRPLGAGGMAAVYLAHDTALRRQVAIKVLSSSRLDTTLLARFMGEAQAVAQLEHAAIVPLYDYGEHDGRPYLVMRYMPGGSLADRIDRGALTLTEAFAIMERIAAALDHAHARRILHRDVKPGNILFDESRQAYLADFGIAKSMNRASGISLTSPGMIIGTAAYMSPEQATGAALDGRSDIYSLGIVLFEMLAGELPYKGESVEVIAQHIHAPIPSILTRRVDLPSTIQRVIERSMAKNSAVRYPTGAALMADFQQVATVNTTEKMASPAQKIPTVGPKPHRPQKSPRRFSMLFLVLFGLSLIYLLWISSNWLDIQDTGATIQAEVFGSTAEIPDNSPTTIMGAAPIETAAVEAPTPPTSQPSFPTSGRQLAAIEPAERDSYFEAPPLMTIDTSREYQAIIRMANGDEMRLRLFDDLAPITVNNFVFLANQGFYDGTTFHRVLEGFMAQGGDPSGTGSGGPGYNFIDETSNGLVFDRFGLLAMANAGPDTNGSQFFITFAPAPHLNGLHTIFGELIEGEETLRAISLRDPAAALETMEPGDIINEIVIVEQ